MGGVACMTLFGLYKVISANSANRYAPSGERGAHAAGARAPRESEGAPELRTRPPPLYKSPARAPDPRDAPPAAAARPPRSAHKREQQDLQIAILPFLTAESDLQGAFLNR